MRQPSWLVEQAGPQDPETNMRLDYERLLGLSSTALPSLRFYEWACPSVSYGYFLDPWDFFDPEKVNQLGLKLAKRPTGGGIIFHMWDFAFSVIVPSSHSFYHKNSLESYAMINQRVLSAVQDVVKGLSAVLQAPCINENRHQRRGVQNFCMANPTHFDLLWQGKKIGGAAQRKTNKGLLHQSSLFLEPQDADWLCMALKSGPDVLDAIQKASYPLAFLQNGSKEELKSALRRALINRMTE